MLVLTEMSLMEGEHGDLVAMSSEAPVSHIVGSNANGAGLCP